ncbi:MAG TPA: hypothetical protein VIK56_13115 [Rhodoferax sp.]
MKRQIVGRAKTGVRALQACALSQWTLYSVAMSKNRQLIHIHLDASPKPMPGAAWNRPENSLTMSD